jgi:hypothetical protein
MAITKEKEVAARELHDRYKQIEPELRAAEEKAKKLQREYVNNAEFMLAPDSMAMREKMSRAFVKVGDLYSKIGALRRAYNNYDTAQVYTHYDTVRKDIVKEMQKIDKELMENERQPKGNLENRAISRSVASLAVIALVGALLTISMNLTGNVIGGSSDNNNWISIGLFFLGCALTLFYFKAKSRIKVSRLPAHKSKKKKK